MLEFRPVNKEVMSVSVKWRDWSSVRRRADRLRERLSEFRRAWMLSEGGGVDAL